MSAPSARIALIVLITTATILGASPFEEGQRLFGENKPTQARALLEEALIQEPRNAMIYQYLGVIYELLGDHEESIQILQKGLQVAEDKALFYLNMGNNFYARGELSLAQEMFTQAIALRPTYPEPHLNRANSRVNLEDLQGAVADYTMYLRLKPATEQRRDIEIMIDLLTGRLEQDKAAAVAREQAEQDLLNQVLNALQNASDGTRNLSKKPTDVMEADVGDIDIED